MGLITYEVTIECPDVDDSAIENKLEVACIPGAILNAIDRALDEAHINGVARVQLDEEEWS